MDGKEGIHQINGSLAEGRIFVNLYQQRYHIQHNNCNECSCLIQLVEFHCHPSYFCKDKTG